jgi:hypothetical protein
MKEHVVEKKVGEIKGYMGQVAAGEGLRAARQGQDSGGADRRERLDEGSAGTALFAVKDYLKPGDSLASANMAAKALAATSRHRTRKTIRSRCR